MRKKSLVYVTSGSQQLAVFVHYCGSDVFNAESDPVSKGIESGLR